MTSKSDAVRVLVRTTASQRYYASSPDLPGLHAYAQNKDDLARQIDQAIRDLYLSNGRSVTATPQSGGPDDGEWIWQVQEIPERACA